MMAIMMKVLEYLLVIVVWKVLGDWSRLEYGDQRHHRNVVVDDVCGVLAIVVPWSPSCLQLVLIVVVVGHLLLVPNLRVRAITFGRRWYL